MGRTRKRLKGGLWLRVAAGAILLAACSLPVDAFAREKFLLWGFRMSPDGQTVAFTYCDRNVRHCRLGLLDLTNDRIVHIPAPSGKQLKHPFYSYDGKRLAAILLDAATNGDSQIVVIDPATLQITPVTEGRGIRRFPVFQPGTGNILYVAKAGRPHRFPHLRLLNLSDRTETIILDAKRGFRLAIAAPSFVDPTEIIFDALGPVDPELVIAVENIGRTKSELIIFGLLFGGRTKIILKNLQSRTQKIIGYKRPNISNITASENGKRIVFIDLSTSKPYQIGVGYNRDLFMMERGKLTQITNLRSHLAFPDISYDGSTVAFGADSSRRKQFDLFILDLKTGKLRPTNLRDRLAKHPAFSAP